MKSSVICISYNTSEVLPELKIGENGAKPIENKVLDLRPAQVAQKEDAFILFSETRPAQVAQENPRHDGASNSAYIYNIPFLKDRVKEKGSINTLSIMGSGFTGAKDCLTLPRLPDEDWESWKERCYESAGFLSGEKLLVAMQKLKQFEGVRNG
jgi:hypothetical protein